MSEVPAVPEVPESRGATRVKVCGITRYEDARQALDLGAWALGFIFYPASPRAVDPERARRITQRLPAGTRTVGVFVDRVASEVQDVVDAVGLHGVQFHGAETPEALASIRVELRLKALRVGPGFDAAAADTFPGALILLDTFRRGVAGGTGETFDWSVARELASRRPLLLSGGLGPENVAAAVREVGPWGVDASSRLEARPGVKDPARVREFFARLPAVASE